MEDTETDKTIPKTTMTTAMATASTSASKMQTTVEVYAKPYTKSAELRGDKQLKTGDKGNVGNAVERMTG